MRAALFVHRFERELNAAADLDWRLLMTGLGMSVIVLLLDNCE
jgi:hypothetical protein